MASVLEEFAPATRRSPRCPAPPRLTLLDAMRGVVNQGTGTAIRGRFGIRADVAGKTGTTQDNTDGWFILMHPQLVAGAWVGFNDNRVTHASDSWGQGARSALPIVGDFFQNGLRRGVIDAGARFAGLPAPQAPPPPEPLPEESTAPAEAAAPPESAPPALAQPSATEGPGPSPPAPSGRNTP